MFMIKANATRYLIVKFTETESVNNTLEVAFYINFLGKSYFVVFFAIKSVSTSKPQQFHFRATNKSMNGYNSWCKTFAKDTYYIDFVSILI